MIPVGYMLKKAVPPPEWMSTPSVDLVYSVSSCVSPNFLDYIPLWKHNGWWFFDDPSELRKLALDQNVDLADLTLFYYEMFEREYDEEKKAWQPIVPEPSLATNVRVPKRKLLQGYDVVTYWVQTLPECSPLSCNMLASKIQTNRFCLLDDFERAHDLAEGGTIADAEPGPYRVIAVYTVDAD